MKRIALALFAGALLTGCDRTPEATDRTASYSMPTELQDCKIFKLTPDVTTGQILHVVRCPNSSTTTGWVEKHHEGKRTSSEAFSVTVTSK